MTVYSVVTDGNVGLVYNGHDAVEALQVYKSWCKHAVECNGYSSVSHVVLTCETGIVASYVMEMD